MRFKYLRHKLLKIYLGLAASSMLHTQTAWRSCLITNKPNQNLQREWSLAGHPWNMPLSTIPIWSASHSEEVPLDSLLLLLPQGQHVVGCFSVWLADLQPSASHGLPQPQVEHSSIADCYQVPRRPIYHYAPDVDSSLPSFYFFHST